MGRHGFRITSLGGEPLPIVTRVRYGSNSDHLLFYVKGEQWAWNPQYQDYDEKYKARFRRKDPDGRMWSDYDITAKGLSGGGYDYEYKGISSYWRVPRETMERLDVEGRLHFTSNGGNQAQEIFG